VSTPQEIQRNAQFQQLLGGLEQLNEMLVTHTAQLTAIANQGLQIRQHLQQLKGTAPTPDHTGYPAKTEPTGGDTATPDNVG
jgi:hypothetical protein